MFLSQEDKDLLKNVIYFIVAHKQLDVIMASNYMKNIFDDDIKIEVYKFFDEIDYYGKQVIFEEKIHGEILFVYI